MMVEVLCGILGGSSFGKNIRMWQTTDTHADLVRQLKSIMNCYFIQEPIRCYLNSLNGVVRGTLATKCTFMLEKLEFFKIIIIKIKGQCFIAIDPECFAEGFTERLQFFIDQTRDLEPVNNLQTSCFVVKRK